MRGFPPLPDVDEAPSSLLDGHLWLQEWVEGGPLRVQLQSSGMLVFGDDERVFEDVPLGYQHAVRHVREQFERDILRSALDDVESAVFYGIATRQESLDYDWADLPPFLGFDVYDRREDRFLPPDTVEHLFGRLGFEPLNAVRKELRGSDFAAATYDVPESAWRDGQAAGVLVRNKTGDCAVLTASPNDQAPSEPFTDPPSEIADAVVTDERFERARDSVTTGGSDAVAERLLEIVAREEYARLLGPGASVDMDSLRSAIAEQTRRRLGTT